MTEVGCWAHVRRKFDESIKAQPKIHRARTREGKLSLAQQGLIQIRQLYQIERQAKSMTLVARHELRQRKSQPVIDELRDWLSAHLPLVSPKSALGKPMEYLHKQWPKLITYLEDGRLRIDSNLTENAIRPYVVGRKNVLFCDSVAGANASANLYSLLKTTRANGLEPYGYLKKVFAEIPQATTIEAFEALLLLPGYAAPVIVPVDRAA